MASSSETGHAKNVANFEHLLGLLTTYGTNYAPGIPSLLLPALQTALINAQTITTEVKDEFTPWKTVTNNREIAFEPLKVLSTSLLNILIAFKPNQQTVKDFKTLNAKVQGSKLTKADSGIADETSSDGEEKIIIPSKKSISTSQQSFDNLIEHFDKIIKLLAAVPTYTPTETHLKVTTLQATLANLKSLNKIAYTANDKLDNARIARNKVLYTNPDSIIELAKSVKAYIKGKYKANSPEYHQVTAIKFVNIKSGK